MNLGLKVISILVIAASIIIPIFVNMYREDRSARSYNDTHYKKVKVRYSVIGVLLAIVLFVVSCSFVIIPTGYTGVRLTFGQIDETTVQNGFNWKLPFVQSVESVNNKQQDITFNGKIWSETAERTAIYYDGITVTYQINNEKSAWIYANVANYRDVLVNQSIVASALKASSKSLSDTDATNRSIIEPLALANLQKSLDEKYGDNVVYVNKVIINNADFDDSYNNAIAARQKAQLEAEQQAIENERAIAKAEADATVRKTNAEAEAAAKLIASEADAQAKIISAEAEAQANDLLEKSLTEQILSQLWIDKWDGKLPMYVSGDESSVMLGINMNGAD